VEYSSEHGKDDRVQGVLLFFFKHSWHTRLGPTGRLIQSCERRTVETRRYTVTDRKPDSTESSPNHTPGVVVCKQPVVAWDGFDRSGRASEACRLWVEC
jgi:hypothetical protein